MQIKLMPLSEYSDCNFNNIFSTLDFFEILFWIVIISKGSAAAKTIASISFSTEDSLVGNFITLFTSIIQISQKVYYDRQTYKGLYDEIN